MRLRKAFVLWFTGLSGSGKTTIAEALQDRLIKKRKKVLILDGDTVRSRINNKLGFSKEDIRINNLKVSELVIENQDIYDIILVPIISPYRSHRDIVRKRIKKNFNEIFIKCSLETCIKRDTKGLYKKALGGEMSKMIGIDDTNPYEPPLDPEIIIDTEKLSLANSLDNIETFIELLSVDQNEVIIE
jgi:adenylyl-sulfate kinase